jgi:hypothetical protein
MSQNSETMQPDTWHMRSRASAARQQVVVAYDIIDVEPVQREDDVTTMHGVVGVESVWSDNK